MKYYAVYDTNVLVYALLTKQQDSATAKVVDAIASQRVVPLYNQEILDEYDEVLHRPKFRFSEERIQNLLSVIKVFGIAVNPSFDFLNVICYNECNIIFGTIGGCYAQT